MHGKRRFRRAPGFGGKNLDENPSSLDLELSAAIRQDEVYRRNTFADFLARRQKQEKEPAK